MLVFSKQQFDKCSETQGQTFYNDLGQDLRAFLADHHPEVDDAEAHDRISQAFQTCWDHGFHTEKQITRLSYILVVFPGDYAQQEDYAWLDQLVRARCSADVRLDRISATIRSGGA